MQEEKQISAKGKRYGETLANSYELLNKYISLKIFVLAILINKKTTFGTFYLAFKVAKTISVLKTVF